MKVTHVRNVLVLTDRVEILCTDGAELKIDPTNHKFHPLDPIQYSGSRVYHAGKYFFQQCESEST